METRLLPQVDGEGVLEVLLAPVAELHHNRVLRGREGQPAAAPRHAAFGPEGLAVRIRARGHEVDPVDGPRVVDRHMAALDEGVVEILG